MLLVTQLPEFCLLWIVICDAPIVPVSGPRLFAMAVQSRHPEAAEGLVRPVAQRLWLTKRPELKAAPIHARLMLKQLLRDPPDCG